MKINKLMRYLAFGAGLGVAFVSYASAPYDECIFTCIQSKRICLASGESLANCNRYLQLCRWGCGTPQ